jgi:hypothetical protein
MDELRQSHQVVGGAGYKRIRQGQTGQMVEGLPPIVIERDAIEDPEMLKIEDFNDDDFGDLKFNPLIIKSAPGLPMSAFPLH